MFKKRRLRKSQNDSFREKKTATTIANMSGPGEIVEVAPGARGLTGNQIKQRSYVRGPGDYRKPQDVGN